MASGKKFYKRPNFITLIIALLIAAVAVPTTLALTARQAKKLDVQVEEEVKRRSTVEGQVLGPDGEPIRETMVRLQVFVGGDVDDMNNYRYYETITDTKGIYIFKGIEPGSAKIGRMFRHNDGTAGVPVGLSHSFEIKSDKNFYITLGGKGRPVIGRLVPVSGNKDDIDWSKSKVDLDLKAPPFSRRFMKRSPTGAFIMEQNSHIKVLRAMIKFEGGNFYRKDPVKVNPDGTFRIKNVRAGQYMFRVFLPEHKVRGFNLFHNFTVDLMRNGTLAKPLNLGNLIVSHDNYKAPAYIDNRFLDRFELDKDIPVKLRVGTDEQPLVVSAKSIRLEKDGELVKASLKVEWESIADAMWQATLRFRSENGSTLARSDVFFKTSKIIEKNASLHNESLLFSLGPLPDLSAVKYFLLIIQPVEKQLISDVQVDGERAWGEAVEGLAVRLRAKGATTAKRVTLLADARNDGPGTYRGTRSTHGCWLKVDGKWYGRVSSHEIVRSMLLKPGDRQLALTRLHLSAEKSPLWRGGFIMRNGQVPSLGAREIHQSEPLELSPGRHTVRLAFPASRKAYAYSNAVEIEILPAEEKPDVQVEGERAWGEAVEGLAVRLRAKGATTAKRVTLLADARNDGPGTYRGTRSTHGCWLKVDGKWYWRVATRGFVAPMLLKAGDRQLAFTRLRLSSEKSHQWRGGISTNDGLVSPPLTVTVQMHQSDKPLELTPGRHSVRLALPTTKRDGKTYAYSNPVEIEILPKEKPAEHVDRKKVWGKEVNGLRAAVEFVPEKQSYSLGERVGVRFHIQNVSDHDIQIASTSWRQEQRVFVQDEQGKEISVSTGWFSGLARIVRYILKPHETVVLESSGLGFGDAASKMDINTEPLTSNFIHCGPGRYFVHYKLKLPDITRKDGDGKVIVPQPDDWQGTLETGKRKLVLTSTVESDQKSKFLPYP